jgi:signal peptidase I
MARSADPDDLGDGDDDEPDEVRPRRKARRPPPKRTPPHRPVRRWRSDDEEDEDDDEVEPSASRRTLFRRESHPVYWRARDSLYFEPLVAVAIIALLLVGLYAYTGNWPPVYVVESDSMQHGPTDVLGLINTGDLVLAQRASTEQITPYVVGLKTGYSTYGEYGDVLLYSPNGQSTTPVIHRAILYLEWDPRDSAYNVTDLSGLPCGSQAGSGFSYSSDGGCGITDLDGTLTLYNVGWHSVDVSVDLGSAALGEHSGYLTMGDNNFDQGCTPGQNCVGFSDQTAGISEIVEPSWIIGVARGMLPWFGSLKLLLEGNAAEVPAQSWQFLGITIVGLILLAFGIHYALRAEGIEDPRRKEEEDEEADELVASGDGGDGRGRRFLRALRPWHRSEDEDEEDLLTPSRRSKPAPTTPNRTSRGRPRPHVRRSEKKKRGRRDRDEEDL